MSKKFFIFYDLLETGRSQDYQRIENVLINNNADRVLINLWVYQGNLYDSTLAVRNELLPLLRQNDRLLVIEASEWAWYIGKNLKFIKKGRSQSQHSLLPHSISIQ